MADSFVAGNGIGRVTIRQSVTRIFLNSPKNSRSDTHLRRQGGLSGPTPWSAPGPACRPIERACVTQIEELRAYCTRRQWETVEEFIDSGVSGSKESRPALNRLLADAKRRRFDAVLVYRYDRFALSLRQLVNALAEFDALGIHFVSLHEGVDTSTPNGRLVFGIFASIAEFERELIRGRVRSGLAAAKARGTRIGRPNSDVDVVRISHLHASGASWREIERTVGVGAEQRDALSRSAWQNPVRFDACKCFIMSGALSAMRVGQIHQILPLIAVASSKLALTLPPLRTKKPKQQQRRSGREPGAVSCEIIPV
jgi:DNA invertase Pin-like site-specific DNA recombinase